MSTTTLSSREFNQHASVAKKKAQNGPVFITNRGRPAHVLLTMEDYQKITGTQSNISDMLAMPSIDAIDFEPPRLGGNLYRPVDLS